MGLSLPGRLPARDLTRHSRHVTGLHQFVADLARGCWSCKACRPLGLTPGVPGLLLLEFKKLSFREAVIRHWTQ
ncbi:hypothetical protein ACTXG7_03885 [Mycolicibacterium sp. Dal123E01]|uniref:hypothetical protein n=1 Tax=Mycolicibacterium sp. Dal123E01 TaxID=3457578 RepID=UPI00403E4AC6